ncbi:MAG: ParB/RepB/Spo0J family partition protein [Paracoccaceae bacterium]
MEKKQERRGLGRGLSALLADVRLDEQPAASSRAGDQMVPVEKIVPNPHQPRRDFDAQALQDLADSLRQKGVIQPLIVRSKPDSDLFEIVAGERRWRASQLAGLHQLPVIVRDFDDSEVIEIAIIENIQRADLNAIEEALAYRQLMDRFGHTQEKVAEALSRSRSHIANLLRLLTLPEDVQRRVRDGSLSAGHARALITSPNASELARQVVNRSLSVRETEKLIRESAEAKAKARAIKPGRAEKDPDTRALESDLSANLNMLVKIDHFPNQDGGQVTIRYRTLEDLDLLCTALSLIPRDFTG